MMKRLYTLFALGILFSLSAAAQQPEHCGTDRLISTMLQNDPGAKARLDHMWELVDEYVQSDAGRDGDRYNIITIPVVFHVIHSGQAIGNGANIADTQMISQIAVLNECYRKRNADTALVPNWFKDRIADTRIEFTLAVTDPDGNPTTGITRHLYANTSNFDVQIKPATIWDATRYLNVWTTFLGNTLLGYATPWGLYPIDQDGVVLDYRYVGRAPANPFVTDYPLGKTAVHEVGHWLGLFHTFQDSCTGNTAATCNIGGDRVCDTPAEKEATFGSPSLNQNTCTDSPVDDPDMWMNYMDYSNDENTQMFTHGQTVVMRAVLNTSRVSILSSLGGTDLTTTYVYGGRVIDANTSAPVVNARVLFDGAQDYEVTTDGNGEFFVTNMYEGYYDIYAGKWGYMTNLYASHMYMTGSTANVDIPVKPHHYYDDFIMNFGWTTSNTAGTGLWTRAIPLGTFNGGDRANVAMDCDNDFGIRSWVTGNNAGAVSVDDVDNGSAILYSPSFDLSGYASPYLRYTRYFYNGQQGGSNPDDFMSFKLNNGTQTVSLENVLGTDGNTNNWIQREWKISDYITPTGDMRLIVEVNDATASNNNITEGGFDRFEVLEEGQLAVEAPEYNVFARLYPNPTRGMITIEYTLPESAATDISIYNMIGEQVLTADAGNSVRGVQYFDVNSLAAGTYFAKIKTAGGEKNIKFLIVK
jgi:hypothetical protein